MNTGGINFLTEIILPRRRGVFLMRNYRILRYYPKVDCLVLYLLILFLLEINDSVIKIKNWEIPNSTLDISVKGVHCWPFGLPASFCICKVVSPQITTPRLKPKTPPQQPYRLFTLYLSRGTTSLYLWSIGRDRLHVSLDLDSVRRV